MLPYDGQPVQAPSTSAWAWDPTYALYFNRSTNQWAKPRPDGGWDYARGDNDKAAAPREQPQEPRDDDDPQPALAEHDDADGQPRVDERTSHRAQVSYDDVDQAPPATAVPEEQLWPASDDDDDDRFSSAPLLRLVVLRRPDPAVLPPAHTVASLDPAEPVSIGRDKSFERRIRLRELAVSKTHCTLFWARGDGDGAQGEEDGGHWAVVDNGSTHGTFVGGGEGGESEVRLSDPKVASTPKRLHHLDTIRTGSTTFAVHIHPSFACTACTIASDSSNLIPLVAAPSDSALAAPTPPAYTGSRTKAQKEEDRREQMALLRGKLLKPAPGTSSTAPSSSTSAASTSTPRAAAKPAASSPFIDRAAARRERNAHATPSPFFAVPGRTSSSTATAAAAAPARPKPAAAAAAADPFASDSRGARLLSKLSGSAGPAAGSTPSAGASAGAGLGTLVEARTYAGSGEARDVRPGLGSRPLVVGVERVGEARSSGGAAGAGAGEGKRDWRGEGRERSYKRLREGE
ncbi:hypothetical protein JCM8208_002518 [Rhodotorula glutinis]